MKKFRYSMENLLQIKCKLEEQAKIAYGNARLKLTQEEEKLEQMHQKKASFQEELRLLRSDKLDLLKIKHCEESIEIMNMNIKQQTTVVRNAAQRLEVARIRLNNAMVERKTQERLKEKAWEEYLLEFDAEERKEVDERNSFHYSSPTLDEEDM
ncbi:flagellar FliJ family protein [Lachnospiraceae bacterium MD1]|uniref:Flagellar FliJ protein n=1 Tax=Variimorphobacter saccharofermentans TaxID=2755051 RepID=A0A839K1C4_9FIRM|nr:flagellar FliJ family protein [Variimorphobacter saccharofermentans]MBB2182739.1 flagellar FliJ family protein [Variimorphobacter saccharofermentans]